MLRMMIDFIVRIVLNELISSAFFGFPDNNMEKLNFPYNRFCIPYNYTEKLKFSYSWFCFSFNENN